MWWNLVGRQRIDHLSSASRTLPRVSRLPRRLVRIAVLTALVLAGCLIATISVGAVKVWPTVRGWAEALLSANENALTVQVRQLAVRLGDPRLSNLSEIGLDSAAVSILLENSGFERVLNSLTAVPDLGPFIRNGAYLQVLQEAARQKVQNLAELKPDAIASAEVRTAASQIQQILARAPGGQPIGAIDPAVVELLGTDVFQQLSRSRFFESVLGKGKPDGPAD